MRFLPVILLVALVVYALVDCVRSDDADMPVGLPKAVWVVLIVVFPGAGALAWLVVSRVSRQAAGQVRGGSGTVAHPSRRPAPRPLAPDDDPDFLAGLGRQRPVEPPAPEPAADADADDDETTEDGEPGTRR
ncbi:MAG TPA: PLD nuclease N-terminal domain-containing protein [Phototrophicaceae bacterium]|uniref:PLDc_N domain-containing protein n=1 Tax=Oceanitalea stevensii TaxID=2763072 RepID=A0ABR8Z100_9MICO|nr:PLD nuclease N-terminal domain-containing protein [Oceanitalea stevensii]MBD8061708.1 PLDc_N domain-containing protein [Oceanitalea stevensii]HLT83019.1 PLD nuclease N-terminal domain-containing protein [Phototrophicaceae bacterium]